MGHLAHRCLVGGCGFRSRRLLRSNCSTGVAIQATSSAALLSARVQLDPSELNLIGSTGAGVMVHCGPWIAAAAQQVGATLMHKDPEFRAIANLPQKWLG